MTEERIQEIFNLMIDEELYDPHCVFDNGNASIFMCNALITAYERELVSNEEASKTILAIEKYIGNYSTIRYALKINCIDTDPLSVYKDWANRPKLTYESLE